jgi:hypothetical protein
MTELALVRIPGGEVVASGIRGAAAYDGDKRIVAPPQAGWQGGGELIYSTDPTTGIETAVEGPRYRYRIVEVEPLIVPAGKRPAGPTTRAYDAGLDKVVESAAFEDIPLPPPEPPPAEKIARMLADYGLTLADLKAELDAAKP